MLYCSWKQIARGLCALIMDRYSAGIAVVETYPSPSQLAGISGRSTVQEIRPAPVCLYPDGRGSDSSRQDMGLSKSDGALNLHAGGWEPLRRVPSSSP